MTFILTVSLCDFLTFFIVNSELSDALTSLEVLIQEFRICMGVAISLAIPGMLLALVLCFDHRKSRDLTSHLDVLPTRGKKYIWFAVWGYAIGLVAALAAGILTHSPQPALLYLVPSTLGPVVVLSWFRADLKELWEGSSESINDKAHRVAEV
ncbi:hypothetical protein GIB67_008345 [Kingdonia uniflora]|uniref:Uncharacterized protein n=1 Tax=Kingdonia uniflora TaxID=39325 RepID=A0A7J7N506_9MAGN|nr:hypothetical protein GIB67_008345 [Kingdonia uniflora]